MFLFSSQQYFICTLETYYQLQMFTSFDQFYMAANKTPLDWGSLEETLRIKESKYPQNQQIYTYYKETFKAKTSSFGRSKWHQMDKLLCIWMIAKYSELEDKNIMMMEKVDFKLFSSLLGIQSELLEFKWLKLIKPYLKNKPWSEEQDKMIQQLMNSNFSKKWTQIALKLSETNVSTCLRTAKQVRERWINYLDPEIKRDEWTEEQDQEMMRMIRQNGKKWSVLGKLLKRTQNSIKNRFNAILSRIGHSHDLQSLNQSNSRSSSIKQQQNNVPKLESLNAISSPEYRVATFKMLEAKICKYRNLSQNQLTI